MHNEESRGCVDIISSTFNLLFIKALVLNILMIHKKRFSWFFDAKL